MLRTLLRFRTLVVLVLLCAALWLTHGFWLPLPGRFLTAVDGPPERPADIVVALAGDLSGGRVLRAAELVADGSAPLALANGAFRIFGVDECRQAAQFAWDRGAPRQSVEPFCFDADSTLAESQIVDAELRRRGVRRALVVTSEFHTRRARYIYRRHTSGQVAYHFLSAPTRGFDPESWWRSRSGQKTVFLEYVKFAHTLIETAS